jgi:hypothetical protein
MDFQTNQALRSPPSYSRRLSLSRESLTLWCLIQGDREAFKVVPPSSCIDVDDLKRVIHTGNKTAPPKELILWKLRESEPLEPDDTFARRVSFKFPNLSEVATKLGPSQKLSTLFSQRLAQDHLHIVIQMSAGTNSDDITIPLPSDSQIVTSKRPSSTSPESDLPSKKLRTGPYLLDTSSSDFADLTSRGVCRQESCPEGLS